MARIMCCRESCNSLLIGTRNRVVELTKDNHEKISASLSLYETEVSRVSLVSKRFFLKNLGVTLQNVILTQNVIRIGAKCNTNAKCYNFDR